MQRLDSVMRWLGAVGITFGTFGIIILPSLLHTENFESAEEQFRAFAEGSVNGYPPLVVQIGGTVFLMAAALGIGGFTIARGRGRALGITGLFTGIIAGIGLFLVLGSELALFAVVTSGGDTEIAVDLATAAGNVPGFYIPLLVGLAGFHATLFLLGFALWRSKVVPLVVPLLFVLPMLSGLIPLPDTAASIAPGLLLLVPCLWISVRLIRGVSPIRGPATA